MPRLRWLLLIALGPACFEDSMLPASSQDGSTGADPTDVGSTTTGGDTPADDASTASPTSESDTTGRETTTSPEDGTDGGSPCPAGSTCAPAVPPGWTGPFAAPESEGEGSPPCPDAWAQRLSSVHRDLDAPPFGCECTCTPPPEACIASVTLYLDAACTTVDLVEAVDVRGCVQTNGATSVMATASTNLTPGPCTPQVVTTPTPATWQSTVALCAPTMPPIPCDEGACLPSPEGGAPLCILQEGEHACPPGPFSQSRILFTSVEDTRECTGCACGGTTGAVCGGPGSGLDQFATGDCSGAASNTLLVGACGSATASARYVPEAPGSCPVTIDTEAIGGASAGGPVTLCCLEP